LSAREGLFGDVAHPKSWTSSIHSLLLRPPLVCRPASSPCRLIGNNNKSDRYNTAALSARDRSFSSPAELGVPVNKFAPCSGQLPALLAQVSPPVYQSSSGAITLCKLFSLFPLCPQSSARWSARPPLWAHRSLYMCALYAPEDERLPVTTSGPEARSRRAERASVVSVWFVLFCFACEHSCTSDRASAERAAVCANWSVREASELSCGAH